MVDDATGGSPGDTDEWQPVCRVTELELERGVAALVHGQAVAVFRVSEDAVYAVANHDPFERTSSLSRCIVGWRGDAPFVASPLHRHAFDLRTGQCLEDPHVSVAAYDVKLMDGVVLVGHRKARTLVELVETTAPDTQTGSR